MPKLSAHQAQLPIILIHGGAGPVDKNPGRRERCRTFLRHVLDMVWPQLVTGQSAVDAVTEAVRLLESSNLFNAGYGASLQQDGLARLSASLMDGRRQKFSGVLLATHVNHPSRLAYALQERSESVLGPLGVQLLARELGIPPESPVTVERARRWVRCLAKSEPPERQGTVGAVALDLKGHLAAATSTGGGKFNFPERVSDSATVGGNYASEFAAIGCTGIGEEIVDDGLAVRLETRVRDGLGLIEASDRVYAEALARKRRYGWIGIDRTGGWVMYWTTKGMDCDGRSADINTSVFEKASN
ncbi:MAG TPA: isoaspartyl peptidase/L-asparaginase [Methylococcaceae bacterium]|nr:isoaspartyl peptidase/L-asparaginase [Methylococcaceae bacterium]